MEALFWTLFWKPSNWQIDFLLNLVPYQSDYNQKLVTLKLSYLLLLGQFVSNLHIPSDMGSSTLTTVVTTLRCEI